MYIKDALTRWLQDRGHAVITGYDLAVKVVELYQLQSYAGEKISVRKTIPHQRDFRRATSELLGANIISLDADLNNMAYRVSITPDETADTIACLVDPFIYVSHLSAMQWHGLTNRNPAELILSRPVATLWKNLSTQKVRQELGDLSTEWGLASLPRFVFPARVRKRNLQIHELRHPGEWLEIRGSAVRMATVGQTFVDMLTRPQWCGTMAHVLEVWQENAPVFLEDIIESVNRSPVNIVKVRAGYVLEEIVGVHDWRIEKWVVHAQRGGSQVLDPTGNYTIGQKPVYSEKWMLSINV